MATNLLLEGDDLEALLIKAHSEGGPSARIVRADKYRHGGLWGFFAKERFEVAVEIPEAAAEGTAFFRDAATDTGDDAGRTSATEHPAAGRPWTDDGYDRTAGRLLTSGAAPSVAEAWSDAEAQAWSDAEARAWSDHDVAVNADARTTAWSEAEEAEEAEEQDWSGRSAQGWVDPAGSGDLWGDSHEGRHDDGRRDEFGHDPAPGALAAEGLLGIADRVSAAERAAARVVETMRAAAPERPARPTSIALPGAELVGATLASMSHGGPRGPLVGPAPARPTAGRPPMAPARPTTAGPGPSTMTDRAGRTGPGWGRPGGPGSGRPAGYDDVDPLELLRAAAAEEDDVPHEPSLNPVRPSTSRPEFTALLDQLRDGARPPRRTPGRPTGRAAAYLDDELAPESDGGRVPAPRTAPAARPANGAGAASERPADERPAAARQAPDRRAAAPDDEEAPETGSRDRLAGEPGDVRAADPRAAADRRVLRELGVPAAWTRRLRSGDRFGEVLRMLERMPDPDIHPDTPIVAVVGPAGSVRLEAHRTAVDLAVANEPRPVVVVPATVGTERATAIARALRSGPVVLAVESDGRDVGLVLDTLTTVQAQAVIALVDAAAPLERTQRWLDALGQVDALALDGGSDVADPAAVLQLGLPVIRFDGVPVDRVTWTALLCAQLQAAEQADDGHGPTTPTSE